ncbi:MAG TPA: hypothetical protein VN176_13125 [Verrucomicrobiae bacterium]|nr:hypothetical protein [Verrucomicrobiae bacterium]
MIKIPVLADWYNRKSPSTLNDLEASLKVLNLPQSVFEAAKRETGFVNYRPVWRNSSLNWCKANRNGLNDVIASARALGANDQDRVALAGKIRSLPRVPTPTGRGGTGDPANLLTPLIACLDPKRRFPVVNGRDAVNDLLHTLRLDHSNLEDQVKGLVGLIGQFGTSDAFMIDVLASEIAKFGVAAPTPTPNPVPPNTVVSGSKPLPEYDEAERIAVISSKTIHYRDRHDRMTNALRLILPAQRIVAGTAPNCRFDINVIGYDGKRDLLIEAKPDPDSGSIRIAVGQLLDYRRFLPHRAGTDLAFLTITRPDQSYVEFLQDLQITVLWFQDESCTKLCGEGKAWDAVKNLM